MADEILDRRGGTVDSINVDQYLWERYKQRQLRALVDCDKVPARTIEVRRLRAYAQLGAKKMEETRGMKPMMPYEASSLLGEMSQEDQRWGFANMMQRISQETSYLDELQAVGVTSRAWSEGLDKGRYGAWVMFMDPDSFFAKRMMKGGVVGRYIPTLDMAMVKHKLPVDDEMWLMMATQGTLPDSAATLVHELAHDSQMSWLDKYGPAGGLSGGVLTLFRLTLQFGINPVMSAASMAGSILSIASAFQGRMDRALGEVDAFRYENQFPGYANESMDEPGEVALHLRNTYMYRDRPLMTLVDAYEDLEVLSEMGATQKEIGQIVRRSVYDKKTETYPNLDRAVAERMRKWQVEGADNIGLVRSALLAKREIEIRYERAKAMKIAGQELRRERGRESWLSRPR